jgi:selenide,water dikinase
LKRQLVTEDDAREVIESMATLNKAACEAMVEVGVHAATDLTGFGVLGHLQEMAHASGCAAELSLATVPLFPRTVEFAEEDVVPGRTAEVISWANGFVQWHSSQPRNLWMKVLCDPQTSGGLMIAVSEEAADQLRIGLEVRGVEAASIGRFTSGSPGVITVI